MTPSGLCARLCHAFLSFGDNLERSERRWPIEIVLLCVWQRVHPTCIDVTTDDACQKPKCATVVTTAKTLATNSTAVGRHVK